MKAVFYPVKPRTAQDLDRATQKIAERVSRYLEIIGCLIKGAESERLDLHTGEEDENCEKLDLVAYFMSNQGQVER